MNTSDKNKTRILLMDEDKRLCNDLKDYFEELNINIVICVDSFKALDVFNSNHFDLIIMETKLRRKDGFTLAKEIRKINKNIPLVYLTSASTIENKIKGFIMGCDDYITKPFNTTELGLRIKAILRRTKPDFTLHITDNNEKYQIGTYLFDYSNMVLIHDGNNIKLTRKEADLLKILIINKNRLVHREVALKLIWGETDYFTGRSMDVFMSRLRNYLRHDENISINNVFNTGFKMEIKTTIVIT